MVLRGLIKLIILHPWLKFLVLVHSIGITQDMVEFLDVSAIRPPDRTRLHLGLDAKTVCSRRRQGNIIEYRGQG